MRETEFDEPAFFQAIERSGARALLIGRRALVVLGLPVLTADYDFWVAIDDIVAFNSATPAVNLTPTCDADTARRRGRYALENDEHVDVLVVRALPTVDGANVEFDEIWARAGRRLRWRRASRSSCPRSMTSSSRSVSPIGRGTSRISVC